MGQPSRILLVDDDQQVLFVLQTSLRRMSAPCEVVTAQDGREAYYLLQGSAFDLLVTDIRLPGIDGVTLTRLARSSVPQIPVVWITAHGCAPLREDAACLQVHGCLEKPVEVREFRQVILQALGGEVPGGRDDGE